MTVWLTSRQGNSTDAIAIHTRPTRLIPCGLTPHTHNRGAIMYYESISKEKAPYDARVVANTFLHIASAKSRKQLTNMKLLKLVYIAHGWYLAYSGKSLIDEPAEAWTYGPVIPSVYSAWQMFRSEPITKYFLSFNPFKGDEGAMEVAMVTDPTDYKFLERVWEGYGEFTAAQLSAMTHLKGTPWYEIWEGGGKEQERQIPNDRILPYYQKLRRSRESRGAAAPTRRSGEYALR